MEKRQAAEEKDIGKRHEKEVKALEKQHEKEVTATEKDLDKKFAAEQKELDKRHAKEQAKLESDPQFHDISRPDGEVDGSPEQQARYEENGRREAAFEAAHGETSDRHISEQQELEKRQDADRDAILDALDDRQREEKQRLYDRQGAELDKMNERHATEIDATHNDSSSNAGDPDLLRRKLALKERE